MSNPAKMHHIQNVITTRSPHAFVLGESKTSAPVAGRLPQGKYNIFEEPAAPTSSARTYKWGVVVGVRKDVQISQKVTVHPSLRHRVAAVDIVISTGSGQGFAHRFIGIYAPFDPGENREMAHDFWSALSELCLEAPNHSWTIAGDCNATLAACERSPSYRGCGGEYSEFLDKAGGFDLWLGNEERTREDHWTSKTCSEVGNIIDRVATSHSTLSSADITAAKLHSDFVPSTDHCGVIGLISFTPPPSTRNMRMNASARGTNECLVFPEPRLRYPPQSEKQRFQSFQQMMDEAIESEGLTPGDVVSEESFTHLYSRLTEILHSVGEKAFGRYPSLSSQSRKEQKITSPTIRHLEKRRKGISGAIYLNRYPQTAEVSLQSENMLADLSAAFDEDNLGASDLGAFLRRERSKICKLLYREKTQEIYEQAKNQDRRKFSYVLRGGSVKRLMPGSASMQLPLAVNDLHDPDLLLTSPGDIKETTRLYFQSLYTHDPPPDLPKPWMETPAVLEVHQRVLEEPFEWPRQASLHDFRAMLRRGNPRPSPGPDGWEKWCIKALSDSALELVLELHNYETMNSCFPGKTTDMLLTYFHKRGLQTDLRNFRGIMLSNFISGSPMTWLNYNLLPYAAKLNIIPETQVATQRGVQTRDVMSYLSMVKSHAKTNNTTVYALQGDQMKGFDYLSPKGFYDALSAYGLPSAIADLDKASQHQNKVFIRTAYGLAGQIIVDGLTKQGGALSPLKSTMTTSLGHRYLNDLAAQEPGALVIKSTSSRLGDPHLPDDKLLVSVNMIEATDDSYIFARDLPTLRKFTLAMERFQFVYNWMSNWPKCHAYILGSHANDGKTIRLPSVNTDRSKNPMEIVEHNVRLRPGELEFLRTLVDDPGAGLYPKLPIPKIHYSDPDHLAPENCGRPDHSTMPSPSLPSACDPD